MNATSPSSFHYVLDCVFEELDLVSDIRISCAAVEVKKPGAPGPMILPVSVNGKRSALQYLHYLEAIRGNTLQKFSEMVPGIVRNDRPAFFRMAERRLRKVAQSVCTGRNPGKKDLPHTYMTWSPRKMRCMYEGVETSDPDIISRAVEGTRRHALIYYRLADSLLEVIRTAAGAAILLPDPAGSPSTRDNGILVSYACTLSFLGARLRLDADRGLISVANVSEHCRYLSDHAAISGNRRFSAQSLRNAYDNPRPEVLEQLEQELKVSLKYLGRLKDRRLEG